MLKEKKEKKGKKEVNTGSPGGFMYLKRKLEKTQAHPHTYKNYSPFKKALMIFM